LHAYKSYFILAIIIMSFAYEEVIFMLHKYHSICGAFIFIYMSIKWNFISTLNVSVFQWFLCFYCYFTLSCTFNSGCSWSCSVLFLLLLVFMMPFDFNAFLYHFFLTMRMSDEVKNESIHRYEWEYIEIFINVPIKMYWYFYELFNFRLDIGKKWKLWTISFDN